MATTTKNKTWVGTELKMLIGFRYPSNLNLTLDDIDFDVEFYCQEGMSHKFSKEGSNIGKLIKELNTSTGHYDWYAPVETTKTGAGQLMMKLTAYLPTGDPNAIYGDDTKRTEVAVCATNVIIEE